MNWILVGMKGCGKTTLGKQLTSLSGRQFFDTDQLIEQYYFEISNTRLNYRAVSQTVGMAQFREWEQQAVNSVSKQSNGVIATGGGALMHPPSAEKLKKSGLIIYLYQQERTFLSRPPAHSSSCDIQDSSGMYQHWQDYYQRRDSIFKQHCNRIFTPDYQSHINDANALLKLLKSSA